MQTFLQYLRSALPLLAAAVVLGVAVYFIVLAVLKRRGRSLTGAWKLWLLVSSVYVFALFMLLIVRGDGFSLGGYGWYSIDLFHEYRSLARSFTANSFINVGMNILIFVPFGFLFALPFGERRSRWLVILLGILATLLVELFQFVTRCGIADVDDVFNNTLGVLCGFAFARMCLAIRARRALRAVICAVLTIAFLSPPFIAWAVSSSSSYGVSGYDPGGRAPVTGEIEFSPAAESFIGGEQRTYEFYSTAGGTLDDARACAERFFANFGLGIETEDLYDESAYFRDGPDFVFYNYAGPEIEFCASEDFAGERFDALSEARLRELSSSWGLEIPAAAVFENQGEGNYRFTLAPDGKLGGTVLFTVREEPDPADGNSVRIEWGIFDLTTAGKAALPSVDECIAELKRGDYGGWIGSTGGKLTIVSAAVEYDLDSKGTFRPMLRLDNDAGESIYLNMPQA